MPDVIGTNRRRILLKVSKWLKDIMPENKTYKLLSGREVGVTTLSSKIKAAKALVALRVGLKLSQKGFARSTISSRCLVSNAELAMGGDRIVSDKRLKDLFTSMGNLWVTHGSVPTTPAEEMLEVYYSGNRTRRPGTPAGVLGPHAASEELDLFNNVSEEPEGTPEETPEIPEEPEIKNSLEEIIKSVDKTLPEFEWEEIGATAIVKGGVRIENPSQEVTLRVASAMMGLKSL